MKTILALLSCLACVPAAPAHSADWQKTWDDTLAAAKQEGKVVVMGSPDPVMRNEIVPRFAARYGLQIEYIAGASGPLSERLRRERASGIYSVDVFLPGVGTTFYTLLPDKMLDPVKPLLLLPEVTDGSRWKLGKPLFADPEQQRVMMLFRTVDSIIFINTDYVKPEEMKSPADLLNPKWKGKIATQDPMGSGSGADTAVNYLIQIGPDFLKKLYVDQKPAKMQDRRQLMDQLARGAYPICLTCKIENAGDLQNEGFHIHEVFDIQGMKNRLVSSPFLLTVVNKAPHPNATQIFVNWLATQEALEVYSRENKTATLRTDTDESFLDPRVIPKKELAYFEAVDPQWIATGRKDATERMRETIKGSK